MERILWVGDAVVPTGFARVTHSVLDRLKDKYEISVLGVNHYGDPHPHDYPIYPAYLVGEPYGFHRVPTLIERVNPDILVLFNDTWIIDNYLKVLKKSDVDTEKLKIVVYFPVDHTNLDPRFFSNFDIVDSINTYTQFGKDVAEEAIARLKPDKMPKVNIIPHGLDLETFFPYEDTLDEEGNVIEYGWQTARKEIYRPDDELMDAFVIFNGNRNSPRKRYDIFLNAFKLFAEGKNDVRVYCHCGLVDEGLDIVRFATDYGIKNKLLVTKDSKVMPGVSDQVLNTIYNTANIGVNTSMGEGWGLVSFEHAATKRPQIVPNHSACGELWEDIGIIVPVTDQIHIGPKLNAEFRIPDTMKLVEAFEAAYEDWKNGGKNLQNLAEAAYKEINKYEYSWDYVAKRFDEIFRNLL